MGMTHMNRRYFAKLIGGVLINSACALGMITQKPWKVTSIGGPPDAPPFCNKMDNAFWMATDCAWMPIIYVRKRVL